MNTELTFASTFLDELPVDPEEGPRLRTVTGACASRVMPTPVRAPRLLHANQELARVLGWNVEELARSPLVDVLAGNQLLSGMQPYASCYGGHQFGSWAGQLGDGRAITLCEVESLQGERLELQLKGAGPTPYSRRADGRAVLRSSLREYVCSEAMHALGVPTTRALSLCTTGEAVVRDMFYDGNPAAEPGAIVCRVAPSFLRFGHFEILAAQRDKEALQELVSYTLRHFFPQLAGGRAPIGADEIAAFLAEVARRTAKMIVEWMRIGFVHGVMNTDNMSILGLTVDYGPYGWVEEFDPSFTPNTTDLPGRRYRYGQQPAVAEWNLIRLAEALLLLCPDAARLEDALLEYSRELAQLEPKMVRSKLGLMTDEAEDLSLFGELLEAMSLAQADMTRFFRTLADLPLESSEGEAELVGAWLTRLSHSLYRAPSAELFGVLEGPVRRLLARTLRERSTGDAGFGERRCALLRRTNPRIIPRNYRAIEVLTALESGDPAPLASWIASLRRPYDERSGDEHEIALRPEWARNRPGCATLSCSS